MVTNERGEYLVHQRALTKKVDPGAIDHVCGGVASGETPEEAAIREALEETGVQLEQVRIVHQGVNSYGRYRYVLHGRASAPPSVRDSREAVWAQYMVLEELRTPLAAMRSEIEVALRAKKLSLTDARQLLNSNLEEVAKLETLSTNLLKLARHERGWEVREKLAIRAVIDEAVDGLVTIVGEKKITVTGPVAE